MKKEIGFYKNNIKNWLLTIDLMSQESTIKNRQSMSQESTISSNDVLSVFQYKTLTAIYYIEMVINIIPTLNQL